MVSLGAVVWTTKVKDFVNGLIGGFHLPYRISFGLFIALRWMPLLDQELSIIRDAHAIRGGQKSLIGRLTVYRGYLFALLINSLRRAELLSYAMDTRGFGAYDRRSFIEGKFRWKGSGIILIIATWIFIYLVTSLVSPLRFALLY